MTTSQLNLEGMRTAVLELISHQQDFTALLEESQQISPVTRRHVGHTQREESMDHDDVNAGMRRNNAENLKLYEKSSKIFLSLTSCSARLVEIPEIFKFLFSMKY